MTIGTPVDGIIQAGSDLAERADRLLTAVIGAERERLVLWLPVAFGIGIGIYFGLAREPSPWLGPAIAAVGLLLAVIGRRLAIAVILGAGVLAAGLGLGVAQWRAHDVAAPVIERRIGPVELSGRVAAVEIRAQGRRVLIDRLSIANLSPERTPAQLRVTARQVPEGLRPGDRIMLRAVLMPPPGPAAPGAYDFQRQAWFDRLGGVGFVLGEIRRLERADTPGANWMLWLVAARQSVVERVLATIPGPAGTIVAALLTGEQGAVPAETMAWMRDSGLAHILSISGLHIGLVAGIVFFAVRLGLALIPFVALRYPIKKWAAVAAFAAISLYTLFASPGVPTQRSWFMTSIVLFAIVIDRTAISMRLVAWAAAIVLAMHPESLLGPSLQMSFAAVIALIAAWEVTRQPFTAWRANGSTLRRATIALGAICLTTLVAGFASAPYALFHFNRFTAYGLAANFLAVPLTSLWVMPWAVLAFMLMPFGLDAVALVPMGWGVDGIIFIAREVAGWKGAVALFPAMPVWGLVFVTLGGLWLCLWQTRWRLAGIPAVLIGLASVATMRGPDILVSGDARLLAVRDADGLLQVSAARAAKLTRETWLRRAGQEGAAAWPRAGETPDGSLSCDKLGCLYSAKDHVVALVRDPAALTDDCRIATIVVATVPVRRACPSAELVIDRFALWRNGGHAIWLESDGARVENVRGDRGERLWVPKLPVPRQPIRGN